jgi:excinuclease ABC subunit C
VAAPFAEFQFDHRIAFSPDNAEALLREIPAAPGVFALRGEDPTAEPYLTRAADLRRRIRRIVAPPETSPDGNPVLSKRLNLRNRVRFIEWTRTGSDFESTLLLYKASRAAFGAEEARRRLRLHPPYFVRITMSHQHPRVYATNRLSRRSMLESYGPFPSRAAAERYCDAVLDLFLLRRCYEDLAPYPEHPGCVYGEMNKCLRPCQQGAPTACTPTQYAHEAARVHAFFTTRGQSLLDEVAAQRDAASEAMDFETAATLHKQWEKVKAAAALADELVRPVADLRAVILQEAATTPGGPFIASRFDAMGGVAQMPGTLHPTSKTPTEPGAPHLASEMWASSDAAVFLLEHGHLAGPERLSTLGVRAVREQTAVGSSLFAQPLMLAPVPLDEPAQTSVILSEAPERAKRVEGAQPKDPEAAQPATTAQTLSTTTPEDRARAVLTHLAAQAEASAEINDLCDALSLFRRWYYRPEKQRTGEVFLPNVSGKDGDHGWPIRRILNGAARVVLGPPTAAPPADREAAKALKTKIIHAGREGVEREVPILPKRQRRGKLPPSDILGKP